jgi:hypothetical protein
MCLRNLCLAVVIVIPVACVSHRQGQNSAPPPRADAPRAGVAAVVPGASGNPQDDGDAAPNAQVEAGPDGGVAPDAARAGDAAVDAGFTLRVEGVLPEDRCLLEVAAQGVVPTCAAGMMRCTTLTRGELAPDPGEELVSRCDHAAGPAFVALSSAGKVLWASRIDESEELPGGICGERPGLTATLVSVAGQAQQALLLQVRGCSEPANYVDMDTLYWWTEGDFIPAASGTFACSYGGDTDGEGMAAPGTYACDGGYLERAPRAADTTFTVVGCEDCRQRSFGEGRLLRGRGRVLETLEWDAESQAFVRP